MERVLTVDLFSPPRSIDDLVKEIVLTNEPALNHLGTKRAIVMDGRLATRLAKTPETIDRLLKRFQVIRGCDAFFPPCLILLDYSILPYLYTGVRRRPHLGDQPAELVAW